MEIETVQKLANSRLSSSSSDERSAEKPSSVPRTRKFNYIAKAMIGRGRKGTKVYRSGLCYNDKACLASFSSLSSIPLPTPTSSVTFSQDDVAVKAVIFHHTSFQKDLASFRREVEMQKTIHGAGKRVVKMIDSTETPFFGLIAMELMPGGDLLQLMVKKIRDIQAGKAPAGPGGGLPEDDARFLFSQIVEGVSSCHRLGVVHRDIKPENVFVSHDGTLKLGDWGLSAIKGERIGPAGTIEYMPPELVSAPDPYDPNYDPDGVGEIVSPAQDMWALGALLYLICAGRSPVKGATSMDTEINILRCQWRPINGISDSLRDCISGLMDPDPSTRTTVEELLDHPWMKIVPVNQMATANIPSHIVRRARSSSKDWKDLIKGVSNRHSAPSVLNSSPAKSSRHREQTLERGSRFNPTCRS